MLRSMYAGISGMKNFQTKLDVIGNNIANVNTYGFKKGRVTFSDTMSQTISGASAPQANGRGGKNLVQIGLGSSIATIDTIHTQSAPQFTGRALDLAIKGEGFFVVNDEGSGQDYFTRAGNFYLDKDGTLVNGDGLFVLDTADQKITIDPALVKSFTISQDGSISKVATDGTIDSATKIKLVKFNNASGLEKAGGNLFIESSNSGDPLDNSTATNGSFGTVASSYLEMSNVDLSEEFTDMIVAQRGFQANTRIITTSDEILQELVNLKR